MRDSIGIRFGALSPKLRKQIDEQLSIKWTEPRLTELEHLQLDCDALVRLCVRGVIQDSEKTKVQRRLMSKITKLVSQ